MTCTLNLILAFPASVGFYDMLRESLLMRTPSSDMWRACVFILGDRLHPAPQTQSLEPRTFCWHSRYLTAHQARAVFACLCRRCPIHRTDLLFCFFFLPSSVETQQLWGSGRWWRGRAAVNSCQPESDCDRLWHPCAPDESSHLSVRGRPLHLCSVC